MYLPVLVADTGHNRLRCSLCRVCRAAIPARYFWTEAGFAVLGALAARLWRVEALGPWGVGVLLFSGLSAGLVFASAVVDARTGFVYDGIMVPALALAAAAAALLAGLGGIGVGALAAFLFIKKETKGKSLDELAQEMPLAGR